MVNCKQCQKVFNAKPSWLKNGYGIFCSRPCKYAAFRIGKDIACSICGTVAYKKPKALNGSKSGKFFWVNHARQNGETRSFHKKNTQTGKLVPVPIAAYSEDIRWLKYAISANQTIYAYSRYTIQIKTIPIMPLKI